MARLYDSFRHLLSFGAELASGVAAGRIDADPADVQAQALALLRQARDTARRAAVPSEWIESASFAMVAWLDETMARHAGWQVAAPLQAQLFNSTNAPSEFFHHLAALQPEEGELREIYWLVLVLGFKGQYHFEEDDGGELGKLKDLHARQLPDPPVMLRGIANDKITPQPYAQADPIGPRLPERRERAVLRTGAALSLLVPLLYWLWLQLDMAKGLPQRSLSHGPRTGAQALHEPPGDAVNRLRSDAASHVGWAQAQ
ncbi:Type IV / vi secretion system, dotu (fragment) [Burkholderiales bacterium 8X]